MHVTNNGPGAYTNDVILVNPSTYTDGIYELKMKYYIESGSGGYFNMGGNWVTGGTGYTYGIDIFFNGDASGNVTSASNGVFSYPQDEWFDVSVRVNVTTDMVDLYINSVLTYSTVWASAPGFGCVDIFGIAYTNATNTTEITSDFYVDDVELLDWTGVGLSEQELASNLLVMPNPSNGSFEIRSAVSLENATISIVDLSGKLDLSQLSDSGGSPSSLSKNEALSALTTLGFDKNAAEKAIDKILASHNNMKVEELIKMALKNM